MGSTRRSLSWTLSRHARGQSMPPLGVACSIVNNYGGYANAIPSRAQIPNKGSRTSVSFPGDTGI